MMKIKYTFLVIFSVNFLLMTNGIFADDVSSQSSVDHLKSQFVVHKKKTTEEKVKKVLDEVTPAEQSVLEEKKQQKKVVEKNSLSVLLFRPTYVLPYYYSASPDYKAYQGSGITPNGEKIDRAEFKAQLSFLVPLFTHLFDNPDLSLNLAYTQLNYWQVYASSQYFREVNYEPEIFIEDDFHRNWLFRAGLDHQSNGRGGELERSWNRAVAGVQFAGEDWLVGVKAWAVIFPRQSSDLHNPDIAYYLGYENIHFSYRFHQAVATLEVQNIESALRRGYFQVSVSYPVLKHVSIYLQYFNGYGQSMIEYNHRTQAAGLGIAFNDWI